MGVWVRGALAAGVVVCSVAAAGCSTVIAGTPLMEAAPGVCASAAEQPGTWVSSSPFAPSAAPRVRVPAVPGWVNWKTFDKDMVLFLRNPALSVDGLTPGVFVLVVDVSSAGNDGEKHLDQYIDGVAESAQRKSMKFTQEPALVCGYPARKVVAIQPMPGGKSLHLVTLAVAVPAGSRSYLVNLTVEGSQPDNPIYKADAAVFLARWQIMAGEGK